MLFIFVAHMLMDMPHRFIFSLILVLSAIAHGAWADAMVSGTVFCDQCKDGQLSMFDYPISGMKVTMSCTDGNGQIISSREETTNWFGSYVIRLDGAPDLSNCYTQVSGSGQDSTGCAAAAGPAKSLRLMFRMFDMEMYTVDPLLSQPAQPMSSCPRSSDPVPEPVTPPPMSPPPFRLPPMPRLPPLPPLLPLPPLPRLPPLPPLPRLPRLPPLPPMPSLPPVPFLEASACPHESWTMPEYRCYWKVMNPDTKVAVAFGLEAARRYGNDMTLWQGLQGRGDLYRTFLREGTTALLNSYNSLQFPYNAITVIQHFNLALLGSPMSVLNTALRFKRANSGNGNVTCKFTTCK